MNLNELLNKILADEGIECLVEESDEFAYYYADSIACYTFEKDEENDSAFLNFARQNGLNEEVSCFVVSFFHEVGHNETLDYVDKLYKGDKDKLSLEDYFNLEEERLATEWAIDFCNSHLDIVRKIEKAL